MKNTRLLFEAALSPGIFNRLSKAVKRIKAKKGFDLIIVYLDDFFIIADSETVCAQALSTLIQLLRKLGFCIHQGKVFCQELQSFLNCKRASKKTAPVHGWATVMASKCC